MEAGEGRSGNVSLQQAAPDEAALRRQVHVKAHTPGTVKTWLHIPAGDNRQEETLDVQRRITLSNAPLGKEGGTQRGRTPRVHGSCVGRQVPGWKPRHAVCLLLVQQRFLTSRTSFPEMSEEGGKLADVLTAELRCTQKRHRCCAEADEVPSSDLLKTRPRLWGPLHPTSRVSIWRESTDTLKRFSIKSGNKNLGATTREEEKHIPREDCLPSSSHPPASVFMLVTCRPVWGRTYTKLRTPHAFGRAKTCITLVRFNLHGAPRGFRGRKRNCPLVGLQLTGLESFLVNPRSREDVIKGKRHLTGGSLAQGTAGTPEG
ncbi:hypothetical protein Cadr_000003796 [Camelus dromedarius]|uniref:Uncharacterized protein n=1 Tax=Camelus dromedarius TaxID=9838 RepID=A0A5N4C1G1_CAMDR|nr:hypothetical protein Cadr_000003796 [Camelus dromedarius]